MPFTGSHPAAVLPLLRTGLPASALVAGSLAPDLPYYLPVDLGVRTHTALAVVTTDLLLGALLWVLWHGVLARPARAWAPGGLLARLPAGATPGLRRRLGTPGQVARVTVALGAGAATHVLWDEFTHAGRWGERHVPLLARSWAGVPGHAWAQELSGVLGGLLLVAWLARWWRRTPVRTASWSRPRWWLPWAVLAGTAAAVGLADAAGAPDPRSAAVAFVFTGGGAALGAAVLLAGAWHLPRPVGTRRRRARGDRDHPAGHGSAPPGRSREGR